MFVKIENTILNCTLISSIEPYDNVNGDLEKGYCIIMNNKRMYKLTEQQYEELHKILKERCIL